MKSIWIAFALFGCTWVPAELQAQQGKKPIQTIIIDPGHGGLDPGAPGMKSTEAQVALEVSLKLGDTIAKAWPDVKLIFTRTTDILPGNKPNKDAALKYRADLANESGGDLFIAVHCNSAGHKPGGWYERRVVNKIPRTKTVKKGKKTYKKTYYEYEYENVWVPNKAKGTETYVWAMNKNDDKIRSVNKTTDYTGEIDSTSTLTLPDPSDPSEKARMLIYAQNYFRKSLNLADLVQQHPDALDAGLYQPNAVRAKLACRSTQASQFMISVMGYGIQGQGQQTRLQTVHLAQHLLQQPYDADNAVLLP